MSDRELSCFFSGALGGKRVMDMIDFVTHRLFSCHGAYMAVARKWLGLAHDHPKSKDREIMLDSGAFSAWTKGGEVSLDDVMASYDEILDRYGTCYKHIWMINLDKIPGERGRTATKQEIEEAMIVSDRNFEILTKRYGDHVLPVFHQDESKARLKEVLQQNPQYVCLSPRNDVGESQRREWSQNTHLLCGDTWTHGLAATGIKMMTEVPWRSVDSASWTQLAGYGRIMICVDERMFIATVSSDSPSRRDLDAHADHLCEPERDVLMAALDRLKVSYEEVASSYDSRAYVNMFYYHDFVSRNKKFKGSTVQTTLFTL